MRPPHLEPLLEPLDAAKTLVNRMTSSPYDPSNDPHARNAKAMLQNTIAYFEQTEDTFKHHRLADRAIEAVRASCRLDNPNSFREARADALRAIDDLEASVTIAGPNDLARAMGLAF